jgi:hypothetical protein
MAFWWCIWIPFKISFEPEESFAIDVLGYIIELFFWLDIALWFRVSYLTFEGVEVTDWKSIAFRYIFKGTFFIDLISVFPFNLMLPGYSSMLDLLGILKIVRIRRLPEIIARLNMSEASKALFKFGQISLYLVVYIHLVTCSWWYAVNYL